MAVKTVLAAILALATNAAAQAPIQLKTADGAATVSLGLLAQGMLQVDSAANGSTASDVYFRRLRFIAGGSVTRRLKFFVESDTPYMGYRDASGWSRPPTIVQDLFVTYSFSDQVQIDAGLLMVPLSYNTTQSAASLLPVAYGPYSFLASAPTHSTIGRDEGAEVRGYLFEKHVEYRAGAFRGAAKDDPTLPLRYAGRVVWYPFGAQTGFFYAGTQHGRRRQVGFGLSADGQAHYRAIGADAFVEWPLAGGDAFTAQADMIRYDGGRTFLQLPRQYTWLVEAGYEFRHSRLGPFVQIARQDLTAAAAADATLLQGGLTYWARGNAMNVKLAVGRALKDRAAGHTQMSVQYQVFVF